MPKRARAHQYCFSCTYQIRGGGGTAIATRAPRQSGCCENTSYVVRMELLRLTLVLPPLMLLWLRCRTHIDLTSVQCCSTYRYGSSTKCMANNMSAAM